jgi:hypothetical protein
MQIEDIMNILKKHVDTVVILGGILASVLWMNGKFNSLEKDMAVMKTVMIIKGIMPESLASKPSQNDIPSGHF